MATFDSFHLGHGIGMTATSAQPHQGMMFMRSQEPQLPNMAAAVQQQPRAMMANPQRSMWMPNHGTGAGGMMVPSRPTGIAQLSQLMAAQQPQLMAAQQPQLMAAQQPQLMAAQQPQLMAAQMQRPVQFARAPPMQASALQQGYAPAATMQASAPGQQQALRVASHQVEGMVVVNVNGVLQNAVLHNGNVYLVNDQTTAGAGAQAPSAQEVMQLQGGLARAQAMGGGTHAMSMAGGTVMMQQGQQPVAPQPLLMPAASHGFATPAAGMQVRHVQPGPVMLPASTMGVRLVQPAQQPRQVLMPQMQQAQPHAVSAAQIGYSMNPGNTAQMPVRTLAMPAQRPAVQRPMAPMLMVPASQGGPLLVPRPSLAPTTNPAPPVVSLPPINVAHLMPLAHGAQTAAAAPPANGGDDLSRLLQFNLVAKPGGVGIIGDARRSRDGASLPSAATSASGSSPSSPASGGAPGAASPPGAAPAIAPDRQAILKMMGSSFAASGMCVDQAFSTGMLAALSDDERAVLVAAHDDELKARSACAASPPRAAANAQLLAPALDEADAADPRSFDAFGFSLFGASTCASSAALDARWAGDAPGPGLMTVPAAASCLTAGLDAGGSMLQEFSGLSLGAL